MTFPRIPLRRAARILNGGTPPSGVPEFWDGEVPFVTPPDLNGLDGAPLESTARTITADGVAHAGLAPAGSVLLSTRAPIGHIGRLTSPAAFNQGCRALVPAPNHEARFLAYALVAARADMDARGLGTTFLELSGSSLAQVDVPLAPLDEQRAIADYLDWETAQIDAFVAKNEELVGLLTERRAAVIADAATGGVRQEARLVDSGVDWIGSIPTNWDVRPLRWSARIRTGTTPSGDMVFADDPGEPWIRPDDLDVSGTASVASRWLTPEGATQGRPAVPGATLVCTIGATLGKSGRIERASYFNQQITSVSWALNDEFLYWVFVAAREAVARLSVGNTLPILNNDKLATLRVPVPPVEEQGVIVDYIRAQTTRIDAAIQTAHRGVALARERRAALISAAVTGKIDVGVAA